MYFWSLLHEELKKSVDFRINSIYWHLTFENFNEKNSGGHFTKYWGGGARAEREKFLIWIPEMAFAAFWEHIL
jgi:hypothetical protein